jgi:hypothetical protein
MSRSSRIPYRNRSPYGWWIASYLERFEYYDEPKGNLSRRCLAWENTIILKARNREDAYRKAVAASRSGYDRRGRGCEAWDVGGTRPGRKGAWRYEGLTSLLPIYDELEHGAEVLWKEHRGRAVRKIHSLVRSKSELEAFDDSDGSKPQKRRRGRRGH